MTQENSFYSKVSLQVHRSAEKISLSYHEVGHPVAVYPILLILCASPLKSWPLESHLIPEPWTCLTSLSVQGHSQASWLGGSWFLKARLVCLEGKDYPLTTHDDHGCSTEGASLQINTYSNIMDIETSKRR